MMQGGAPLEPAARAPIMIGRYVVSPALGSGRLATVHLGRLVGAAGFTRIVAIRRLHPHLARDPYLSAMLIEELRLAARIQHPNVVPVLDVVIADQEMLIVTEYARGDSLAGLIESAKHRSVKIPPKILVGVMCDALEGLHAAHEAVDENGDLLGLVHQDLGSHKIIVGVDGASRVLDFGIAEAERRLRQGDVGRRARDRGGESERRALDIFGAGLVVFEALTGHRMFPEEIDLSSHAKIPTTGIRMPSEQDASLAAFDVVVEGACGGSPEHRFKNARELANALGKTHARATPAEIADWVVWLAAERLERYTAVTTAIERASPSGAFASATPDAVTGAASARYAAEKPGAVLSRWLPIALGGSLMLGAAGFMLIAAAASHREGGAGSSEESSARPEVLTSGAPSAGATTSGAEVATAPPPESPTATASSADASAATASAAPEATEPDEAPSGDSAAPSKPPVGKHRTWRRPRSHGAPAASSKTKTKCETYVVDSTGNLRFNPDCAQ